VTNRWIGTLFVAAGLLGTFAAFLPPFASRDLLVLPSTIGGVVVGFVVARRAAPLGRRGLNLLLLAATVMTTFALGVQGAPSVTSAGGVFCVWIALFAGAFCNKRDLNLHLAVLSVGYAIAVVVSHVPTAPTVITIVVGTCALVAGAHSRLTQRIERSEARFRMLAEWAPMGLFTLSRTGECDFVNPAWTALTGLDAEAAAGTGWRRALHPDDAHLLVIGIVADTVAHQTSVDHRLLSADGSVRRVTTSWVRMQGVTGLQYLVTVTDMTDRFELERKLAHDATHDVLTGLANRALFVDRSRRALATAERTGVWPALMFVDLDHFKAVNDTHGHGVGDELLVHVAQRLRACLRDGDTVARIGGDEFVVLAAAPASRTDTDLIARRIIGQLSHPYKLQDEIVAVIGASVGIARGEPEVEADELLRRADRAVYLAKDSGRGVHAYDDAHPVT
jgi:diguanylate cyclase (GGDEF)-like protein/PAS domain S-box-containing protein